MRDKEDDLISVQYKIEKSEIKQQKLEDSLVTMSDALHKSKRTYLAVIVFLVLFIGVMAGVIYYNNGMERPQKQLNEDSAIPSYIERIYKTNDSLKNQIDKLKLDVQAYQKTIQQQYVIDTSSITHVQNTKNIVVKNNDTKKTSTKYKRQYAFVKRVFRQNGTTFIEADYILYYEGKTAVTKAKENGEAEYDIDEKGDTLYFLYDKFYVYNKNPLMRILELDSEIRIQGLNQISTGFPIKAFQKIIADNPILILQIDNGVVYNISKKKLPR